MSDQRSRPATELSADASSSGRWARVQDVFMAAIECTPAERAELLARECGEDADLRREVQGLLDGHDRAGLVDRLSAQLEAPARWRAHVDGLEWKDRKLGQYVILEPLGAGAMGWVYKARDERLGRAVALKFLPPYLSAHPQSKERFLHEARAAAALDHPNICTIHEIGESPDGQLFIAMPLYEGETLQARLDRGPLRTDELTSIALQVASGIARAHEHGIVHRDVKPSNIMLLPDGTVKVVDFGIARSRDTAQARTDNGVGTVAYMSPEQSQGESVDHRTDIWSLGVVLYEMATGTRPFSAEGARALREAILTSEPEPATARRTDLPVEMDEVISKALSKVPQRRYASMAHMANELAALAGRERFATLATIPPADVVAPTGERRRAAVLVSMVGDYAALVERHTPEKLESLLNAVRTAATEVVRRHGGSVNHAFDDEIASLFGVPVSHEDDDLRAVRAALELHARVLQITGSQLRLQSGVHTDLMVAQRMSSGPRRYAITGTAVQLAQRLAAIAAPDSILISAECRRVVAPFIETVPQAAVAGLTTDGPVTPYRVIGESGLQTRLEAALQRGLTNYAGRRGELATLIQLFERARAGLAQTALVVGEAGVGKSRLLYELERRVRIDGVRVLQARCRSYGVIAPYQPFVDMLRQSLHLPASEMRGVTADDIAARVCAVDPALQPFIPLYLHLFSLTSDSHPLQQDSRGEHLQQAMPEALAAILTRFAHQHPTVLLIEDWQWSDLGSREALRRLVDLAYAHSLFVVVTSRPERIDDWAESAARVQLSPLDFEACVSIMQDVLHVERISDDLARRLYERTSGNPFFLEEICHTLREQGAIASRGGEAVVAGGTDTLRLPDTAQAVIRARLDAQDKESLDALRVASVIGREFTLALLREVADTKFDVVRAIDRLNAAGLIQQTSVAPAAAYRFKHVLTHEVTYESLLGHQRRSWHEVIGRAMERIDPLHLDEHAQSLAYHFTQAEIWDAAVRHGRRAADRANALSQFADALALLDRVQDCIVHLPDGDERVDLSADVMLQQERLCETLGQRGRQQHIVDELISLLAPRGASARLAQVYLRQGDLLTLLRRFDAADRALSTALRMSREYGDAPMERHAVRSIGLLRWHEGRHAEALTMTERALAIDRERHDYHALAGDLNNCGMILKSMGEYARAIAAFEETLTIPALASNQYMLVYSLQNVANVYRSLGQLDRALEYLQRADDLARSHLLPITRSFHLVSIAHIFLQQGRVEESLQTYREAVELSRRARHADGLVQSLRTLGDVLCGLHREEEALPHLQEAASLFAQLEDGAGEVETWSKVASILERRQLPADAAQAWEKVRTLSAQLEDVRSELDALEGIARATRQSGGSADQCAVKFEAALTLATALGEKTRELALRNTLGILEWERGEYARALTQYEAALGLARELANRSSEGLILNSLGVTLSRLSRHEEALTVLHEAQTVNRDSGEQLLEAHALAALGDVYAERRRFEPARECFERSLALRRSIGDRSGEERMQQRLAFVRSSLGQGVL
jgi:tetratricopeptide (TPR) repeat protein/class 3 adenylate cyclase